MAAGGLSGSTVGATAIKPGDGWTMALALVQRVALVEERVLEAGDVAVLPPPPQDIHAQQGLDGAPVYEFVLFGANTMILPRLYFDPMHCTAREVQLGAR